MSRTREVELHGVVVDFVEGGTFIYCNHDNKIYKIPDDYYERNRPSQAELAKLSRTQRERVLRRFAFADNVAFTVSDVEHGIVDKVRLGPKYHVLAGNGVHILMESVCVVSDETPRRVYALIEASQTVNIDADLAESVLPNVAVHCKIAISVDARLDEADGDFRRCVPQIKMDVYSIDKMSPTAEHIRMPVNAPWNVGVRLDFNPFEVLDEAALDAFDAMNLQRRKDEWNDQFFSESGFFISRYELFCPHLPHKRITLGKRPPAEVADNYWLGRRTNFRAYWSPWNKCYAVFEYWLDHEWDPLDRKEVVAIPLADGRVTYTIKVNAQPTGIGGYFRVTHLGLVYDKDHILDGLCVYQDRNTPVYIRHWRYNGLAKFLVVSTEDGQEPAIDESGWDPRRGSERHDFKNLTGLVIDASGSVIIKEFAHLQTSLPNNIDFLCRLGEWLRVDGFYEYGSRSFTITRAYTHSEAPTLVAELPNGAYAFKLDRLTLLPREDFFMESRLVGFVEAASNKFERFLRAWNRGEELSVWVTDNWNDVNRQARLRAVSIEQPGPLTSLLIGSLFPARVTRHVQVNDVRFHDDDADDDGPRHPAVAIRLGAAAAARARNPPGRGLTEYVDWFAALTRRQPSQDHHNRNQQKE